MFLDALTIDVLAAVFNSVELHQVSLFLSISQGSCLLTPTCAFLERITTAPLSRNTTQFGNILYTMRTLSEQE